MPNGPKPQNTGFSSVDHEVDRIIGRDAELRLREMQKRQDLKRSVIHKNATDGFHLSRQSDGDYRVMTDEEKVAAEKGRNLHLQASEKINAYLKRRKAKESANGTA